MTELKGAVVEFPVNGRKAAGYLSKPGAGSGPGVLVIQEWWGLVENIKNIADRFAASGYVALAPDLYHGESTKSPDEAGKLMMALAIEETEKDLRGASTYLLAQSSGKKARSRRLLHGGATRALRGEQERCDRRLRRLLRNSSEREAGLCRHQGAGPGTLRGEGPLGLSGRGEKTRSRTQARQASRPTSRSTPGSTTVFSTTRAKRSTTSRPRPKRGAGSRLSSRST